MFWTIGVFVLLAGGVLLLIYLIQTNLIFFPSRINKDYQFNFPWKFEEKFIKARDGKLLHGLLFRVEETKGLVFYLHGNAGGLDSWGYAAEPFLENNYDVFILDYRGFGKSEGVIKGEQQMHKDVQAAYDLLMEGYNENETIILGYSIGSGFASRLAAKNHPKMLLLLAPFYNLPDLVNHYYPFLPKFLLKFKFMNNKRLQEINCPIVIFHGDRDEVVYYGSSLKLKEHLKPSDSLFTLEGQLHNGIDENPWFLSKLKDVLP